MNRLQFQSCGDVQDFVSWAGRFRCDHDGHLRSTVEGALSTLVVSLNIPKSGKVPVALNRRVPFSELTRSYSWKANGMYVGDFAETRATVDGLMRDISSARTREAAVAAAERIMRWGGDRNSAAGATPFLSSRPDLVGYLDAVKAALTLELSNATHAGLETVLAMNSMLTKIHAFNSSDGLPIYDSRVAGAAATLVETWRGSRAKQGQPLPTSLTFPAVGGGGARRGVRARYPQCTPPPTVYYAGGDLLSERALRNARTWASAKVRLGWLLSELLDEPSPRGMRSLEASFFMAGYDCSSINR